MPVQRKESKKKRNKQNLGSIWRFEFECASRPSLPHVKFPPGWTGVCVHSGLCDIFFACLYVGPRLLGAVHYLHCTN